ncbi:citrate lyase holo-[acyl-carrier protein] synthase, partial [Limosilactobacillus mucosae]|uniref:citrate lyase holo-[acyl-carrier protein] synthase n=1 Tax=Limosilactobacillus mucosae TaxID=97478 RepID=UPI00399391A0
EENMNNLFANGTPQRIPEVLANRDRRVALQNQLTRSHPDQTVIAAKLNIPGPIKNNETIKNFFVTKLTIFEKQLQAQYDFKMVGQWLDESTGPERFYLVDGSAAQVKQLTTEFEEAQAAHRLFDLDVLSLQNNQTVSISRTELGLSKRQCLICGRPAKECARSRRHSVAELQDRVAALIENF